MTFTKAASRPGLQRSMSDADQREQMVSAAPTPAPAGSLAAGIDRPDIGEVAVVRLPIADSRGTVSGYELLFANGRDGATPGINSRATAAMIDGAFADIGLD